MFVFFFAGRKIISFCNSEFFFLVITYAACVQLKVHYICFKRKF